MDIKEVRANAKERMKGFCRVCPVCDGRACAGETPGMGGIGTGSAFKNNVAALAGVRLNMRLIHEVKKPVTETEVLGFRLRLPVLAAPIGGGAGLCRRQGPGTSHELPDYGSACLPGQGPGPQTGGKGGAEIFPLFPGSLPADGREIQSHGAVRPFAHYQRPVPGSSGQSPCQKNQRQAQLLLKLHDHIGK